MTQFNVNNKVAIVTGSSLGIGKAIALALGLKGAKVVINGRDADKLARAKVYLEAQGVEVLSVKGDITQPEDCKLLVNKTIEAFSRIDILVNNAGTSMRGAFDEVKEDVFKRIMDVNYLGAVYMTKAVWPHIIKEMGSIVFISSLAGIRGLPHFSAYSAAKMSLTALEESLTIELAGSSVHTGVVYVGFTEIEDEKKVMAANGQLISIQARDSSKAQSLVEVAGSVVKLIEKRKSRTVLTRLGKVNWVANKYFPRLAGWVLIKGKKKFLEGMK